MNDGLRGTYSALQGSPLASPTSSRQGDGSASAARSSKKRRVHGTAPEEVVASVDPVAASRRLAPQVSLNEYVGYAGAVTRVREAVVDQLSARESYAALGVDGPRGVLVHGPPGCGKTLLCRATAGSAAIALAAEGGGELSYFELSGGDLGSGPEAEMNLERLLSAATTAAPSLVFLDDLDVLIGCGGGAGVSNGSIASRLCGCLDALPSFRCRPDATPPSSSDGLNLVVVLATVRTPDSLDTRLRRLGRFAREVAIGAPDRAAREAILDAALPRLRDHDVALQDVVRATPGWVGADLVALADEAGAVCARRVSAVFVALPNGANMPPSPLLVTHADVLRALTTVEPCFGRSGFSRAPDVDWKDVGALAGVRDELTTSILAPIADPDRFAALGVPLPAGVLLYGPPGCGKTLLARAVARASDANFINVKGPELLNKYVGESERAVRALFARASASAPCIVFFDEVDALIPRRGGPLGDGTQASGDSNGVTDRVVNQLLTELDGLETRGQVYVVAATNRPELVDPAFLRPGRVDKLLFVPLPRPEERVSILVAATRRVKLHADVNLAALGQDARANGFSGADLAAVVRTAGLAALKQGMNELNHAHFDAALGQIRPSVSSGDAEGYNRVHTRIRGTDSA
ncbi:hypothetical protein AURANDRAFT_32385 [Aureococcus anophagefferens]|uniref:AAA+ ATPase domain-containing protein n=1 Tax=Aureococcus anophagefferens TaxID=44056 RepID=F0YK33_AURAN|nr:hypothetical protein AURANDRAFT_32385 [Aureococcus anophagefferens]EGB04514.1 hypothetical protein AURANDRAFT_32385 [Aureococcus anophagefferens]|eukprot:XP_009040767.1 hypothetical protein AURANDRAFT_32385 [Aureococcus anophagefferens]